jgi:hypothetical protein
VNRDLPPNAQLRWEVEATAEPGAPGTARVSIIARNPMAPELSFEMLVDWHAGAEAADVEGRALVILSLLAKELAAECERVAGGRFEEG